jgi:hypothetical protein
MKLRLIAGGVSFGLAAAVLAARMVGVPIVLSAQQPACLHGPEQTADQKARVQQAVFLARQINTAEARASMQAGVKYMPREELAGVGGIPAGFDLHLSADRRSYAFSIKDTTDPCRFAMFSDTDGLIYNGTPMQ